MIGENLTADLASERWASAWWSTGSGFSRRDRRAIDVARVERIDGGWLWVIEGETGKAATSTDAGAAADRILTARGWRLE